MVELRKRPPPKEPPAPAPAAKKGRASSSKAKSAVAKVKEAVGGRNAGASKEGKPTAAMQPTVEDERPVEKDDAAAVPETVATAPSTATAPAAAKPAESSVSNSEGKIVTESKTPAEMAAIKEKAQAMGMTGTSAAGPGDDTHAPESAAGAATTNNGTKTAALPLSANSVGQSVDVSKVSSSVQNHKGESVSVASLLSGSPGVIIFTYPRASTPGCTQQACMFRDHHANFTAPVAGLDTSYNIYGLSTDSVKANANFAAKQNLQYDLLCDPDAVLTGMLGMKKPGNAKGTLRGVVVIGSDGVVKVWYQGGPAKTVDAVKEFLEKK